MRRALYAAAAGLLLTLAVLFPVTASGVVIVPSQGTTITGTANTLAVFNATGDNVADSQLTDDGTDVNMNVAGLIGMSAPTSFTLDAGAAINPTKILIDTKPAAGASGSYISLTNAGISAMDNNDTVNFLNISPVNANHTGANNVLNGVLIGNITGDAQATENAITVGTGWDNAIRFNASVPVITFGVGATYTGHLDIAGDAGSLVDIYDVLGQGHGVLEIVGQRRIDGPYWSVEAAGNITNTMNGTDGLGGYDLKAFTDANHTGSNNLYTAFHASAITGPDAQAVHTGVFVAAGWDAFMIATAKSSSWNGDVNNQPPTNTVAFYVDESVDRGAGIATADCALIGRLSSGTEVVISVLVTDGGCP